MGSGETAVLRREIATLHAGLDESRAEIKSLKERLEERDAEIARLRARLAYYEAPGMPTSQPSLYNAKRAKFRKSRGEDPAGSPGDRKEPGGGDGGAAGREGGKKRGPPVGHAGVSHGNKPARQSLRYGLEFDASPCCGLPLAGLRPKAKLVGDLDGTYRMRHAMVLAARAGCAGCGRVHEADTPFVDGTSFGPVTLGIMLFLFEIGATDRDVADFFRTVFGFGMSDNAVWNARRAIGAHLRRFQIEFIKLAFLYWSWVNIDETKFKRGDGHHGYVWLACTPGCVFVWFAPTRSGAVLEEHFGWLRDSSAVCDGYTAYPPFFASIQRCWRHMLAAAEEPAVRNRGADEAIYDMLLEFYRGMKRIKTLAPLTCMELSRRAYSIIIQHRDKNVRTYLLNALPDAFTFLAHPGMSPHNNDAERELRDAIIPQRNRRHKLVTPEGRETFSTLVTFAKTCRRQGISSSMALLESILDSSG